MSANSMKAKMWSAALFTALVLSAMHSVRADEATYNYWEGGSGNSWTDKNSETGKYKWTTGGLPTATETAAFKQGKQTVKIKEGKCLAAKVVFESDSVITFSRLDSGTADAVTAGEFSGEGTLKLLRTGLKAADAGCTVSVAGFEVLHDSSYPSNYSWLDGGTAESKKMVVESAVTGGGNLACNNYVEVNGDVTLTGFLKLSANATVKNLVYDNGGCKIATDSAGGTIEKVTVKSGTLDYSSSTLKSVSVITVGKFVLDGGTLVAAPETAVCVGTGSAGGVLVLSGTWESPEAVKLPDGMTFADEADLTSVAVIATVGIAQVRYSVSKTGGSYVLKKERATSLVYTWTGAAGDKDWQNGANWDSGTVPAEENTACFAADADVVLKKTVKVQEVRVEEGARVVLRSSDIWNVHPSVDTWSVTGGGCLALGHAGLRSARTDQESLVISVATLEIINNCQGWSDDVTQKRDSWIEGNGNVPTVIESDLSGWRGSYLICRNALSFSGDNGRFLGRVVVDSVNNDGWSVRHFATPESLFSNANTFLFRGKMCLDFTEGTVKLGTVEFGESWGASFELKSGADVTLEVADGRIVDSHFGDGFEVNGGRLTVKKVGPGTLVYGVVKAHVLEVTEGRVEFTGEGDDSAVSVIVRAGASIGNAPAQTSGNGTKTGGAAVTVHHAFTFDEGAVVAQTISADEDGALSVPVLTVAPAFDVTNVRFGFTNPELLPPVVYGTAYAKYPVADSPALTGTVRTVGDGISPDGSSGKCVWKADPSGNTVIFRTYCPGLVVIVK